MAHLVLADHTVTPTPAIVRVWLDDLRRAGYTSVRTGALDAVVTARFERLGFVVVQRLVLLSRPVDRPRVEHGITLRGARGMADLARASAIDIAAFGDEWGLDPRGIADACTATPRHLIRVALLPDRSLGPIGYAVTGRAERLGFLQRLAVHPDHRRQGVAAALVTDSMRWLSRRRASTVMVNTHADNDAALALYERFGFRRHVEELCVLERDLDRAATPVTPTGMASP